jgi:hypothetical protein
MSKEAKTQGALAGADGAASRRSVVVIGGGPGGFTAAALLALDGHDQAGSLMPGKTFPMRVCTVYSARAT